LLTVLRTPNGIFERRNLNIKQSGWGWYFRPGLSTQCAKAYWCAWKETEVCREWFMLWQKIYKIFGRCCSRFPPS